MGEDAPAAAATNGSKRPRGRPRTEIDLAPVADAVAELFAAGGEDAVTIDLWVHVVKRAMDAGELEAADPVITTRLLLGQCLWVSR